MLHSNTQRYWTPIGQKVVISLLETVVQWTHREQSPRDQRLRQEEMKESKGRIVALVKRNGAA